MKLSLVTSSENSIDPLLIFTAMVAIFVVGFVVTLVVLTRRTPGHHPQVTGHQGQNFHDASTTSTTNTTVTIDKLNLGSPRLPGS